MSYIRQKIDFNNFKTMQKHFYNTSISGTILKSKRETAIITDILE